MRAMEISRTGLDVEWRRLEVIAENLANIDTTRMGNGEPYRPLRLISGPAKTFNAALQGTSSTLAGVAVYGVEPSQAPPRRVYDPGHPHAGADGFVTFPAIDHAAEMTLMISTSRAYEANLVAMSVGRQMYTKALELGHRS